MLIRVSLSLSAALAVSVLSVLSFASPQNSPSPSTTPPTSGSAPLSDDQKVRMAAVSLGLTPEALVASGYIESDVTAVLSQINSRQSYVTLKSARARSGNSGHANGAGASSVVETERDLVLNASVPVDARRDCLRRCIKGMALGLPPQLAIACSCQADQRRCLEALIAEKRSVRLGIPLEERPSTFLNALRSSSAAAAASQALNDRLASVRSHFGSLPGHPQP